MRLRQFLTNRHFSLIKNEGLIRCVNTFLKALCWIFIMLPVISLLVWSVGLILSRKKNGESIIGGIAVLLVGLSLLSFAYSIFKIKWNHYRMTKPNMISLCLAFIFFTTYQFVATLMTQTFFGYSAVFLSTNALLIIFLVFLNAGI